MDKLTDRANQGSLHFDVFKGSSNTIFNFFAELDNAGQQNLGIKTIKLQPGLLLVKTSIDLGSFLRSM